MNQLIKVIFIPKEEIRGEIAIEGEPFAIIPHIFMGVETGFYIFCKVLKDSNITVEGT